MLTVSEPAAVLDECADKERERTCPRLNAVAVLDGFVEAPCLEWNSAG